MNDKAVITCVLQHWWAGCLWPTSMCEFSLSAGEYSNQLVVVLMYSMWVFMLLNGAAAFSLSCSTKHPLLLSFLMRIHTVCQLLSLFTWLFFDTDVDKSVWCLELLDDSRLTQCTRSLPMGHYWRCECWSAHWDSLQCGVKEEIVGEEKEKRKES